MAENTVLVTGEGKGVILLGNRDSQNLSTHGNGGRSGVAALGDSFGSLIPAGIIDGNIAGGGSAGSRGAVAGEGTR